MYLCHSEILMSKDTESLGNNKAPACESRGFVRKIMKVCILTHLLAYCLLSVYLSESFHLLKYNHNCISVYYIMLGTNMAIL